MFCRFTGKKRSEDHGGKRKAASFEYFAVKVKVSAQKEEVASINREIKVKKCGISVAEEMAISSFTIVFQVEV